jgi:trimethylamine--corrinoid protein Co-methyltransferase
MLDATREVLSRQDMEAIHKTSLRLLEEVGVTFPTEEAIGVFEEHGVKTDGDQVFLTERQVMDAIEAAPGQFTIHARNPERSVTVGDGKPVFAPGYGAPVLVDAQEGKRTPTMEDYDNLAKLAHALPNQDMMGHLMIEPGDVPADTAHVRMLYASMIHSDKAFVGSAAGRQGARDTMEMASILFGEEIKDKPVTVGLINSLSPLGYSGEMLDALLEYARWRQPVVLAALSMAGSTGPVTLAGVLAHQTAELLAGVTLAQLASPGTPVIFGSTSTNLDMKTGALAIGSPELSQMIAAHAALCRFYGLPSRSGGALTDANYPDAQAGFESMLSLMTTVNSGIDFVLHAGGILSSYLAFSYEKLVLDDEMCGMVRRFKQGITVTPETLVYDIIAKVGSGGNYLMESHTLKRCRTEFWQPNLSSRMGLEAWMTAGRPGAVDRARERWQKLVGEHEDPAVDGAVARQLKTFMGEHTQ